MSHFLGDGMKRTTDDLQCDWVDFRIGDVQFLPPGLELGHLPMPRYDAVARNSPRRAAVAVKSTLRSASNTTP